jgi:5-methylcytosine-specific restriction enzyme A
VKRTPGGGRSPPGVPRSILPRVLTPTVCAQPGCPEVATHRGRCQLHAREARRARDRPGSTRLWRRLRALVLKRDGGLCVRCDAPATEVHHRDPLHNGGLEMCSPDELVSLCHDCHVRAHAKTS